MIHKMARLMGIHSDFATLFFSNEYRVLAGEKSKTIIILISILFFTFLALGFAVGSIQNLRQKMDNPFTNWVNLNITSSFSDDKALRVEEDYQTPEKKELFNIADVRGWSQVNLQLYHQDYNPCRYSPDTLLFSVWGRILESEDPLSKTILAKNNQIWLTDSFYNRDFSQSGLSDCEVIVSEKLLKRLGYATGDPSIGMIFTEEEGVPIALKVVGVVKELPKFCEFICAPKLYNIIVAKRDTYRGTTKYCNDLIIRNVEGRNTFNLLAETKPDLESIKSKAVSFFNLTDSPEVRIAEVIKNGTSEWILCEISFAPINRPDLTAFKAFLAEMKKHKIYLGDINRIECEGLEYCQEINFSNYHYLSFNFNRLYDIRAFQKDIRAIHGVDIDMSQVEAKENFALVGWLTWVISFILLLFGILSIILFVNNLLSAHLYRVRTNLGTFKAFGLSDKFLNEIYVKIIVCFLIFAIAVAFGGAMIVDRIEGVITGEESKFNIFGVEILVAILILIGVSIFISSKTIKSILGDTPGNLIYGR